jgi:hypothetical protein
MAVKYCVVLVLVKVQLLAVPEHPVLEFGSRAASGLNHPAKL